MLHLGLYFVKKNHCMNKVFLTVALVIVSFLFMGNSFAQTESNQTVPKKLAPLTGNVQENDYLKQNSLSGENPSGFVKDALSGLPISGANISLPDKNVSTISKADGSFKLNLQGQQGNFILSVKKEGYLPFALNAKADDFSRPFVLHIEKFHGQIVIDSNIHHLGDNNYSDLSANASAFKLPAEGPTFIKEFYLESLPPKGMVLKIGSIIGLDTMESRELGQSHIDTFSSPLSIYVNSVKVAEIAVNENNKAIPIYNMALKAHAKNLLVLQTGINQIYQYAGGIDYDDIEFMNIILEHYNTVEPLPKK